MEKASDVYNKLKLRFVGKGEVAAKPKTENKELEDNGETKNTGKGPDFRAWIASIFLSQQIEFFSSSYFMYFHVFSRLHSYKWGHRTEDG